MNGTCTIVDNGSIKVLKTVRGASGDYSFFQALGMIFGHLASDLNTPSSIGNRGMGIPAPLMVLFGMLKGINIGGKDIAEISEYMYVNGYDARHFSTLSIPVLINEILIRVLYILKEVKYNNRNFIDVFKETIPLNISPRFRMMLNLSYGGMVAINAGKVAITKDILNANYAMWMVFTWHTFHSMQWLLWTKNTELQKYIDEDLPNEMVKNKEYVRATRTADVQNTKMAFDIMMEDKFEGLMVDYTDLYRDFSDKEDFKKDVLGLMFDVVQKKQVELEKRV